MMTKDELKQRIRGLVDAANGVIVNQQMLGELFCEFADDMPSTEEAMAAWNNAMSEVVMEAMRDPLPRHRSGVFRTMNGDDGENHG